MSSPVSKAPNNASLECAPRIQVDPRGPRFGATITTIVLASALILNGTTAGTVLIAWQTLVFALGAIVGLQAQPYGIFFRKVVRPRLAPARRDGGRGPARFAQAVGLVFLVVALVGALAGATAVTAVALAFALAAAFLNAAFAFCLGCEMYLLGQRLAHR